MLDPVARRQLLLTRIALERAELARDLARLRRAARPPELWRSAVNATLGLSRPTESPRLRWLGMALALLRRHPVVTSALGLVAPLLRGRRWVRRTAVVAAIGGVALGAILRAKSPPGPDVKPPAPPSPPSP